MKNYIDAIKDDLIFRIFVDEHPSAILLINPENSEILYANRKALAFYGYDLSEITDMQVDNINILKPKEILKEIKLAKSQQRNYFEFVHQLKSGVLKKVNVMSYPLAINGAEILMSYISERENYVQGPLKDINQIFSQMDDTMVLIRKSDEKLVYKSVMFLKTFGDAIVSNTLADYLSDASTLLWSNLSESFVFEPTFSLDLYNQIKSKYMTYKVFPFEIHNLGETFIMLKFLEDIDLNRHEYVLSEHLFDLVKRCFGNQIGRLICLECVNAKENIGRLLMMFQTFFSIEKWQYQAVVEQNCVLIYSVVHDLNDWLMKLHAFISYITFETGIIQKGMKHNLRIGVSMTGHYNQLLFDDLNEVMSSFKINEGNAVHISERTGNYYEWMIIKNELNNALIDNQFRLYRQDIFDVRKKRNVASEFLLRWLHPVLGIITPGKFIEYAESTRMIVNIDLWVINAVFEYLSRLNDWTIDYHINISTLTLNIANFTSIIVDIAEKHGTSVSNIVFEITESSNIAVDNHVLRSLKDKGFRLAIDDFGSGYSSFERIKNLDIDWIKIDKSFIDGIGQNLQDTMILKAIIALCEKLEIDIIAEGAETYEQVDFLTSIGCYNIQGYYFSKSYFVDQAVESSSIRVPEVKENSLHSTIIIEGDQNENGNHFKDFFYKAPVAMILLDEHLRLDLWNNVTEKIFDIECTSIKDKNFLKSIFTKRDEYHYVQKTFFNTLSSRSDDLLLERTLSDGSSQICRWYIKYNNENRSFLCIVSDITDAYKKNAQLSDFKIAMDQIATSILVFKASGLIQYANRKALELFERENNIYQYHIDDVLRNRNGPLMEMKMWESLYNGVTCKFESVISVYSGANIECRVTLYPAFQSMSDQAHFVLILEDISKEKRQEKNEMDMRRKLYVQDKTSTIGLLTSGIVHELNNPLTYIKSNLFYLENILMNIEILNLELKQEIKDIFKENGEGLNQMSNLMLDMKRFIYKDSDEVKEKIDLIEEMKSVINLARNEYKYHSKVVFLYDNSSQFYVHGQASKIKQIFMNLLINASYAVKESSHRDHGEIKIEVKKRDKKIEIAISDNGCGMSEETLLKLFNPLFTTKPSGIGTGLGMSIVKDLIENSFYGCIEVKSVLGVGTSVYVYIPEAVDTTSIN